MSEGAGFRVSFQPTITLGAVLQIVSILALAIMGYTHITDRLAEHDNAIAEERKVEQQTVNSLLQVEINDARTAALLSDMQARLTRDENRK